ncbi:MAG: flavin reductase family protein [Solirubrobacterales bacterium]|nr:flavin reductase family protein [Solirubrobacterales bacterium]
MSAFGSSGPAGATASAVCSLSLEPMMMLVCLDLESRSLEALREARRFGISVLGEGQQPTAEVFASKVPQAEKWTAVNWRPVGDVPLIEDGLAQVVCSLAEVIPGGDHVIVTGLVEQVEAHPGEPLIYHGGLFRSLVGDGSRYPRLDFEPRD